MTSGRLAVTLRQVRNLRYPAEISYLSLPMPKPLGPPPIGPAPLEARVSPRPVERLGSVPAPAGFSAEDAPGAPSPKLVPPAPKGGPASNLIAARQAHFSRPPETLAALLSDQSAQAAAFVGKLLDAVTFFGGARIQPGHPYYAVAEQYGEALLLANVARTEAGLFEAALRSGLFSAGAVQAAKGVVVSLATQALPPPLLAQAFATAGGDDARLAAALAKLAPLPELSLRARTGAGPGIMDAVAKGYVEARAKLATLAPPRVAERLLREFKAQGSRMGGNLPFEQKASPYIEEMDVFHHFIPRRLALTEGAPVFSIFPGGIGTLNELFEVLRADRAVLFEARAFWQEAVDVLETQWRARGLVDPARPPRMAVADGPAEGLPMLLAAARETDARDVRGILRNIEALSQELQAAPGALAGFEPAVSFVGGRRLASSDPEVHTAGALAETLARAGLPVRLGGPGALFDAVVAGTRAGDGPRPQAFLLDGPDLDHAAVEARAEVGFVAQSAITHKPLMYENTLGMVALPGGVGTMDEVFELACLISTGNAPPRPIVLVGRDFWAPIIDAFERTMDPASSDPAVMRAVKQGEFRRLFTLVDDAESARAALAPARAAKEDAS